MTLLSSSCLKLSCRACGLPYFIMVLEINATLEENDFEIKEINEEERITFQNGEN